MPTTDTATVYSADPIIDQAIRDALAALGQED